MYNFFNNQTYITINKSEFQHNHSAESNFRFDHVIDSVENSLTEVTVATSIAEEIHEILSAHTNFTFMIQREMTSVDHLRILSANIASTELVNISTSNQSINKLARHLNYQAVQLRKVASLLESVTRKISRSAAVEESLQRVKVMFE